MIILVCGGRSYTDAARVEDELDDYTGRVHQIIHGGAPGADAIAGEWARTRCVQCKVYPADWQTYGRAAGPIRNTRMLADGKPDLVIAFPGGRGTASMIEQARAAGVPVVQVS